MGCAASRSLHGHNIPDGRTEIVVLSSEQIDEMIKEDALLQRQTVKLLLLGSSDSGKSTLVKQMKILHTGGFTDFEFKNYRHLIFRNIVEAVESLVEGAAVLDITFDSQQSQEKISLFFELAANYNENSRRILELASEIGKFDEIQECFAQKHRLALFDNVEYFLSNLHRIASDDYIPNHTDILYCRSHTSGIYCTEFRQSEKQIKLIDVGGQKCERRKWIHCFDDVMAILFVAALSGYDQVLEETATENRMFDALSLFDEICKSDYFLQTTIVLFLNKKDVFEEKIKIVPLTVCFTDYSAENDYENASAYICSQFVREHEGIARKIYSHFTNATDTQNIEKVFDAVVDTLIGKNIGTSGLE